MAAKAVRNFYGKDTTYKPMLPEPGYEAMHSPPTPTNFIPDQYPIWLLPPEKQRVLPGGPFYTALRGAEVEHF